MNIGLFKWHEHEDNSMTRTVMWFSLPVKETKSTFTVIEFRDGDPMVLINRYQKMEYKYFRSLKSHKLPAERAGQIVILIFEKGGVDKCDLSFVGSGRSRACI